jgi:hypothetical protein
MAFFVNCKQPADKAFSLLGQPAIGDFRSLRTVSQERYSRTFATPSALDINIQHRPHQTNGEVLNVKAIGCMLITAEFDPRQPNVV